MGFKASTALVEQVLLIALEGARNVRRHAGARSASIEAHMDDRELVLRLDDDGVGFPDEAGPPDEEEAEGLDLSQHQESAYAVASGGSITTGESAASLVGGALAREGKLA